MRHTARWLLVALTAVACDDPAKPMAPAPGTQAGAPVSAVAATDDAEAARALFDESVRRHLAGDEVAWKDGLLELAARYPDTPHGRAARRRIGGAGEWVVATGVMAAVAVPAFMKYIRRSKTAEATMNVRKMFDGAVAFYAEHQRFPQTTPLSPGQPACQGGESTKMPPNPDAWTAPGWQELNFSVDDPHYYRYEFVSEGSGPGAQFTARAIGDLNCDGVLATFERVGRVDEQGNVTGGAGLFMANELE